MLPNRYDPEARWGRGHGLGYVTQAVSLRALLGRNGEPMATRGLVTRDQFEVTEGGVTHEPTGCSFTPCPRSPTDGTVNRGQLGSKPANGERYHPDDVEEMARRLWLEYLAKQW